MGERHLPDLCSKNGANYSLAVTLQDLVCERIRLEFLRCDASFTNCVRSGAGFKQLVVAAIAMGVHRTDRGERAQSGQTPKHESE